MPADTPSPRSARTSVRIEPINEGIETVKRVGESAGEIGAECLSLCSDQMAAALDTATRASQVLSGIGRACFETYSASIVEMTGIGREALTCRSPADVVNLQKKAMESMARTLENGSRLTLEMFGACSQAAQPLLARTMDTPERLFRAIAEGDMSDRVDLNLREVA